MGVYVGVYLWTCGRVSMDMWACIYGHVCVLVCSFIDRYFSDNHQARALSILQHSKHPKYWWVRSEVAQSQCVCVLVCIDRCECVSNNWDIQVCLCVCVCRYPVAVTGIDMCGVVCVCV